MRVMILATAYKFSWRNVTLSGKEKELLQGNLLGVEKKAKADR
jgi:hypothetical protein